MTKYDSINPFSCVDDLLPIEQRNKWHFRGTNIGGWLVLEPWITPSLFYQFLGPYEKWGDDAPSHVAFDSSSFCTVLGKNEANKQLRRHWASWLLEEHISAIAATGVDTVRIPVGDWMFLPYEPFIGCFDGALDEFKRAIMLTKKYNLSVLIDIHGMKGGQNAFDNSGFSNIQWTSPKTFNHILSAGWIGQYNISTRATIVNESSINHALAVIRRILHLFKNDDNIIGLEPVNEPFYDTPVDILKKFYWEAYKMIKSESPKWITIFHDSFRLNLDTWGGFLENCSNFGIDSHMYLAWQDNSSLINYKINACNRIYDIVSLESNNIPVIIGEWSLATDNCAMWLNGFNNNILGFPKKKCALVKCPYPYMGSEQPGAPPNSSKGLQDPFGSGGFSSPIYGFCPIDASFEDNDMALIILARSQLQVFESSHGQFFWNFRTELEPRWSYLESVKRGWLPHDWKIKKYETFNECNFTETILLKAEINQTSSLNNIYFVFSSIIVVFLLSVLFVGYKIVNKHVRSKRDLYVIISESDSFRDCVEMRTNQNV